MALGAAFQALAQGEGAFQDRAPRLQDDCRGPKRLLCRRSLAFRAGRQRTLLLDAGLRPRWAVWRSSRAPAPCPVFWAARAPRRIDSCSLRASSTARDRRQADAAAARTPRPASSPISRRLRHRPVPCGRDAPRKLRHRAASTLKPQRCAPDRRRRRGGATTRCCARWWRLQKAREFALRGAHELTPGTCWRPRVCWRGRARRPPMPTRATASCSMRLRRRSTLGQGGGWRARGQLLGVRNPCRAPTRC